MSGRKYAKKAKQVVYDGTLIMCLIIFFFMAIGGLVYFLVNL